MILVINTPFHLHGLMVLLGLPVATPLRSNLFNTLQQPHIKKARNTHLGASRLLHFQPILLLSTLILFIAFLCFVTLFCLIAFLSFVTGFSLVTVALFLVA